MQKLEIRTVRDLLFYLPFRYDDFSSEKQIADLNVGDTATVLAMVELLRTIRVRGKRMTLTEAVLSDDSGQIKAIWFNQPFLKNSLPIGGKFYFSGTVEHKYYNKTFMKPVFEPAKEGHESIHTGGKIPIYPATEGISPKQIRFLVSLALKSVGNLEEGLPEFIQKDRHFLPLADAIRAVHFPENDEEIARGRERIEYEKWFWIQGRVAYLKKNLETLGAMPIPFHEENTKKWVGTLPFTLTDAQKKVSWRILQDLGRAIPANRLVQGDVGSGKTVVAFMAIANAFWGGFESVLLAPTEILAKQHFSSAKNILGGLEMPILLLTRSDKIFFDPKESADQKISEKEALFLIKETPNLLVIGTHTILEEKVRFLNLNLIIVDEQHRFGVRQRGILRSRFAKGGLYPHYISMTATPIPRSLALFLYGDLDVSMIGELPPGRKPVATHVVGDEDREKTYDFIRSQIAKSKQIFVICPLISPSDKLGVLSVEESLEHLKKDAFPDLDIRSLHGKLKAKEKDVIMSDFKQNKFPILVSTSVVEVGVDIPNATIMMIEGAERFGLSQLHQFRGRVGRAEDQSYCFLFPTDSSRDYARLLIMENTHNGLELAQQDLELRGAGDVYGTRQSGDFEAVFGDGNNDYSVLERSEWVEGVRADVESIFAENQKTGRYGDIVAHFESEAKGIFFE